MRRPALIVAAILLVGLAGTAIALKGREGNTQLADQQQALAPVDAAAVERLLLSTSDPRPGHGGRARAAHCSPGSDLALGNPWSCVVRYPAPPSIDYHATVYGNRSLRASGLPQGAKRGTLLYVRGCCTGTP
ncbi:MAG TPA: hypothetical protein VHT29_08385 [Solirubrobacteraceae bacterium]|nr:hypothetical protein [Solirubrobacteraceae bacterium]